MADESLELEDGELVVNGPSSSSAAHHVHLRAQLDEAATALRHRGQEDLARLAVALVELGDLRHVMWVLYDEVRRDDFSGDPALFDAFRHTVRRRLLNLQENGYYSEHEISESVPLVVLEAAQHAAYDDEQPYYGNGGGFGAVPASAAAVRRLEKRTFRAAGGSEDEDGFTECSICSEEFVDGGQVTVMPCPSRVHTFHPDCISKWLAISNMCPLCRHELPAYYEY